MEPEVDIRVSFCVGGDFSEPRARHHYGGGGDELVVERCKTCDVLRVRHGKIICIQNEQFGFGRVAKSDLQGLTCAGREYRRVISRYFPIVTEFHKYEGVSELRRLG